MVDTLTASIRVLMIEDNPPDAAVIRSNLREAATTAFDLECTATLAEGLARLQEGPYDVLLLDLDLPDSKGHETIRRVTEARPDLPVVIFTVSEDETLAVEAIAEGVQDYFVKGTVDERLLARAIKYAIRRKRSEVLLQELSTALEQRVKERTAELELRRQAEARLLETTAELERSNKELEQFAYVASHDLQEPLRMVSSFIKLLHDRYGDKLDDKANEYFAFAVDGAERMEALIHDLLVLSQVERQAMAIALVEVQAVVDRALADLGSRIEEAGAAIAVDPLPAVRGDAAQLTRLFQNLIGNAIKYRREGCRPEIRIGAAREQGQWRFWVKDNGLGIDPKFKEEVFVAFRRFHAREKYAGTGIGLAICRKIVERYGGIIGVESRPGEGSTFFFTIPDR